MIKSTASSNCMYRYLTTDDPLRVLRNLIYGRNEKKMEAEEYRQDEE